MNHIRTYSISSPGTRYPAEKVLIFRVVQPPLSRMSCAPGLPRVPRLVAATKDED